MGHPLNSIGLRVVRRTVFVVLGPELQVGSTKLGWVGPKRLACRQVQRVSDIYRCSAARALILTLLEVITLRLKDVRRKSVITDVQWNATVGKCWLHQTMENS